MWLSSLTCFVLFYAVQVSFADVISNSSLNLSRRKREWIMPPKILKENTDYSHLKFLAKIRSDQDVNHHVVYSLEGVGANKEPLNVFYVDPQNGNIRLSRQLDRELIATYYLKGVATFQDGSQEERKIEIIVKVEDENDNSPVFMVNKPVSVQELSVKGTFVMKVNATDADEPGNPNSQIVYRIVKEVPPEGMLYITTDGNIHVNKPTLDREKTDRYILIIEGQDLNGAPGGNTGTGTVTINVLDVNDNPPTLEKAQYEVNVEENSQELEVLRIKADDLDLRNTENWEVVYEIVGDNGAEYFSINTDPETNEGVLRLEKPLDYETIKQLELKLTVKNKAPGTSSEPEACTVLVNVMNQEEGPYFEPEVKAIPIREGEPRIQDVITRYTAFDPDTRKPAENVRYLKGSDPDNWLTVDPTTAEIRLNKLPDRESPFMNNGTYYAKVLCITEDVPSKTATGTLAIQVEDFNDNCPILTSETHTMCTSKQAVFIQASDEDSYPNGPPFQFAIVPEGTRGKWEVEYMNDTTVILRALESTWPGLYEVEFLIWDEQGKACPEPQIAKVIVCTCVDGVKCGKRGGNGQPRTDVKLGPACIGPIILGLVAFLFLPLVLLFFQCGKKMMMMSEMPFEEDSRFIQYNSESPQEYTGVPLIYESTKMGGKLGAGLENALLGTAQYGEQGLYKGHYQGYLSRETTEVLGSKETNLNTQFYSKNSQDVRGSFLDDMALPYHILGQYFTQKTNSVLHNMANMDGAHEYNFEGLGSPAGSLGCCSLLESDNDLSFLDDLSEKFRTLADVCGGLNEPVETQTSPVVSQLPGAHKMKSIPSTDQHLPRTPSTTVSRTVDSVVKQTSRSSQVVHESSDTASGWKAEGNSAAFQGQRFLLQQQAVYFATPPVMQAVQYVVQPKLQTNVVLTDAPATHLQSVVLVNGARTNDALISVGTANTTGMFLVEGGRPGKGFDLIQSKKLPRAQTSRAMEGKAAAKSQIVIRSQSSCSTGGGLVALRRGSTH